MKKTGKNEENDKEEKCAKKVKEKYFYNEGYKAPKKRVLRNN